MTILWFTNQYDVLGDDCIEGVRSGRGQLICWLKACIFKNLATIMASNSTGECANQAWQITLMALVECQGRGTMHNHDIIFESNLDTGASPGMTTAGGAGHDLAGTRCGVYAMQLTETVVRCCDDNRHRRR
jgi:hypothetical protein